MLIACAEWLAASTVLAVLGAPATAPYASAVTAEQRAADDALANLIDEVMKLPLASGQTVSEVLASSAEADCALRRAVVAEHQQSHPRRLAYGIVEVDAWLPTPRLAERLRETIVRHLPETDASRFAPHAAAGLVIMATGRYVDDGQDRDSRPGWRHCDGRQIALAQAAAEIDLRQNLMARIGRLRLAGQRTVGDLLRRYPSFREAVQGRVDLLAGGEPVFEPTGLCRRAIQLPRAEIIALLQRGATESGARIDADFSQVIDPGFQEPLTVEGFAVAPPSTPAHRAVVPNLEADRPAWADQFLTARAAGKAPADAGDEQARRELAATAARIEAARQLWIKIENLPLPDGATIASRLAQTRPADDPFRAIDEAILPVTAPVFGEDGSATVTLGIRLDTVWRIMRDQPGSE